MAEPILRSEYEKYTDEELIEKYRAGETGIIDYLMVKYKNLVPPKPAPCLYSAGTAKT